MNPRNPKSKSPLSSSAEEAREELLHRLHTKRRRGRLLEQPPPSLSRVLWDNHGNRLVWVVSDYVD